MVVWIIVGVVVVAVAALVWWSSGRARQGPDHERLRTSRGVSESDVSLKAGRPTGGQFHPGSGSGSGF